VNLVELYKSPSGETQIEVRFENETVWLLLNQIAELFERDNSLISRYLKIFIKKPNLIMTQLLQKIQQFKKKEKELSPEKLIILIWMPLFLLEIV
jgi:hypothetical protein